MSRRLAPLLLAPLLLSACAPHTSQPPAPAVTAKAAAPVAEAAASSDDLAQQVLGRLRAMDANAFRAVSAKSSGSAVLLTGVVTKPVLRRQAEKAATAVPGVATVHNGLLLAEDGAFPLFAPDPARERTLAARLAAEPAAADIGIRVVNGAAYLIGSAPSPADLERVKALLLEDPDLKWVDTAAVAVR